MRAYAEDRPFTLAEVDELVGNNRRSVWLVEFNGVKRLCRVGSYVFGYLLRTYMFFYGDLWRAWPYQPSKELRERVPWEDGHLQSTGKIIEKDVRERMKPYHDLVRRGKKV